MAEILLSICIPVYNREKSLKRQLNTLVQQYCNQIEVIVSDNDSSDGTQKVLLEYSKRYPWLVVNINDTNLGVLGNCMKMLSLAHGKYIYFLGDDDLVDNAIVIILQKLGSMDIDLLHFGADCYPIHHSFCGKTQLTKYFNTDSVQHLTTEEIVRIVGDDAGRFLFMSINIYSRTLLERMPTGYPNTVFTLSFVISALAQGKAYFSQDELVYCNPNISWKSSTYHVWFCDMPDSITFFEERGMFSHKQAIDIRNHMIAHLLLGCINKFGSVIKFLNNSNRQGYINIKVVCLMFFYALKHILRKLFC